MIYFKNKKKKTYALEGVLYIDEENFAVAKAVMRIKAVLDISGIHEFDICSGGKNLVSEQHYFQNCKR